MSSNNTDQKTTPEKALYSSFWKPFFAYWLLCVLAFGSCWYWLSSHLEDLLTRRVNDLGHQIVSIAADASSEAVVSEDTLFLSQLVQDISSHPFVATASVFRIDGTLIADYQSVDHQLTHTEQPPTELQSALTGYLPQYQSITVPFVTEIDWQNNPVGWFQISLNRYSLESDIRTSSYHVTLVTLSAFFLFSLIGLVYFYRTRKHPVLPQLPNMLLPSPNDKKTNTQSLSDAVALIKNGSSTSSGLQFKTAHLATVSEASNINIHHDGAVTLIALRTPGATKDHSELVNQLMAWHSIIFEAGKMFEVPCYLIGRHQFLITSASKQLDNVLQLIYLLQALQEILQQDKKTLSRCCAAVTQGEIEIRYMMQNHALVSGEAFGRLTTQLRTLKQFAWIDARLIEHLTLVEKTESSELTTIGIESQPEKTVSADSFTQSLNHRRANTLLQKYWPNYENTENH